MHLAQRFERLLDETTGGVVHRSSVTNLSKGRIENPGYEKMMALARAMGFPPGAWFDDFPAGATGVVPDEGQSLADRIGRHFETIRHPRTGEPFTYVEVARMSAGVLSGEDVEGIRTGRISDPTVGQITALAAVFGVPPSYIVDRGKESSGLDEEALAALSDEMAHAILQESARLPGREKEMVLGIVRQFAGVRMPSREPS